MSETFKVIETQEQLDAIIKDRVARAESKAAEKYADYDELKASNEEKDKQIADLSDQIKAQAEKATGSDDKIKELESKVHEYETASVKTRVAHEVGLPYELASKLSGDDEDAIRADAKAMVKFVSKPAAAPLGSSEPDNQNVDPEKAAYKKMLNELNSKGE